MEAQHYSIEKDLKVLCSLCPHSCRLRDGQSGICRVRTNSGGLLKSDNYGKLCSLHLDPIEKKPLYHFYPGRNIFSVGSVGCNLHCRFCQNWEISQTSVNDYPYLRDYSPQQVVDLALAESGNMGLAYTYNEPTVWFEFMKDIATMAADTHLKNVMVTNGFINQEPLNELLPIIDAFSVDLKAFTDSFYRQLTSSRLEPVLEALKSIRRSGRHLEITNLLIPGENDDENDFRAMMHWISDELGPDTILHISRFFPTYKLMTESTPETLLFRYYGIAREYIPYVYLGNVHAVMGRDTLCPQCGHLLVKRSGYHTSVKGLDKDGRCSKCGEVIPLSI
ncbi:MAG TPA: AmmeMemoRadiSam system radical SAM enzyme [Bacteroidales bacterium]|nr:AmmeMemoRadiSam system radical SAM enzyme [Bacteroidales bacterium]